MKRAGTESQETLASNEPRCRVMLFVLASDYDLYFRVALFEFCQRRVVASRGATVHIELLLGNGTVPQQTTSGAHFKL